MSIQGDGFFIVRRGTDQFYTRAGAFTLDGNGRLATPQGTLVQGWTADAQGVINANGQTGDILMPVGALIAPQVTKTVTVGGNLPSNATNGTTVSSAITIYDDNGAPKNVTFAFTRNTGGDAAATTANGGSPAQSWTLQIQAEVDGTHAGLEDLLDNPLAVSFDMTTGQISAAIAAATGTTAALATTPAPTKTTFSLTADLLKNGTNKLGTFAGTAPGPADLIQINFDGNTPLTQFSGVNSLAASDQDGSAPGALQTFTISQDGVITGVFSNGRTQSIAQIAIATFSNPAGLEKLEGSMYRPSANSGLASIGVAGLAGRGTLAGGTLEMSNVDLAQEFTNLIVAQRGFQANTRVITASDEVLSDLVQMKR
jgi:flagellar hook protein FlgE